MNSTLTITFQPNETAEAVDAWWLRLEQEEVADDVATVQDAASLFDAVFQTEPCGNPEAVTGDPAESLAVDEDPPVTEDEFATIVQSELDISLCKYGADGSCEVKAKVFRSHLTEPFKLNIEGGEVVETVRIREEVTVTEAVDGSSITIRKPFVTQPQITWLGSLFDQAGPAGVPEIGIFGSTLNFGKSVTGTIQATFTTEYDMVTIKVYGVDGEPGEGRAIGFYHGQVEELDLQLPELDESVADASLFCPGINADGLGDDTVHCYELVHQATRCQCSEIEASRVTVEQDCDCPDNVRNCPGAESECRALVGSRVETVAYIDCGETTDDIADPEYYKQVCCHSPSGIRLPKCSRVTSIYRGGMGIDGGAEKYRAIYGPNLRIVPVGPPGGNCGTLTVEQRVTAQNCCDGVPPIIWDSASSITLMNPGSSGSIEVTGGKGTGYVWTIDGEEFAFTNGLKTMVTSTPRAGVITGPNACGSAAVSVTDGCSSAQGWIRCTEGRWVTVYQSQAGINGDKEGTPPFAGGCLGTWTGTGLPYTVGSHSDIGYVGKYKVRQDTSLIGGSYAFRSTWDEALAACEQFKSSGLGSFSHHNFEGFCFEYPPMCMGCGACSTDGDHFYNRYIGLHGTITPYPGGGGYTAFWVWTAVLLTVIDEWVC